MGPDFTAIAAVLISESLAKRIEFDLHYLCNWSLSLDLMIMAKTVAVVWADRQAY